MFRIHLHGHKCHGLGQKKLDTFLRCPNPISPPAEAGAAPLQKSAICAEIPTYPSYKKCRSLFRGKWVAFRFV